jgi:hypothetical protein
VIARTARQFPLVIALVVVLALTPIAFAAKGGGGKPGGGGGSGGSLTGPVMVSDVNTAGLSYGDEITFTTSASWTLYPSVEVDCAQNGAGVYKQIVGFYPTYIGSPYFTLSGYWWTGGAANCTATLYYTAKNGSRTTLATTSFTVAA